MLLSCQGQKEEPAHWLWLTGEQFFETFSSAVLILCRIFHYIKCKLSLVTWPLDTVHHVIPSMWSIFSALLKQKCEEGGSAQLPIVHWSSETAHRLHYNLNKDFSASRMPSHTSSLITIFLHCSYVTMNKSETSFHVWKPKELVHYMTFMAFNHKFL